MANPIDLRAGVRVEYTGDITPEHFGKRGTVQNSAERDGGGYLVKFDDGSSDQGLAARSLTILPGTELDGITWYDGDRVAYTGDDTPMNGWHGTVVGTKGHYVKVRFDAKFFTNYMSADDHHDILPGELTKLDMRESQREPTTKEWTDAYNLLERLGTVTFTIRKAPFDAIDCGDINGGGDYRAVVYGDVIKVGCQRISFETADRIMEAVAKAREWQAIRDQTFSNDPAVKS